MLKSLESISLIIASLSAIYGIFSWRIEAKWKKKFELAEETLILFYKVKDSFRAMRNPLGYVGEGKERQSNKDETVEEKIIKDRTHVIFERYEKEKDRFAELNALKYKFIAHFGKDKAEPFNKINDLLHELFITAKELRDYYWRKSSIIDMGPDEIDKFKEEKRKKEEIFYGNFSENDEFHQKVGKAVNEIELTCNDILNPNSFWLKFFTKFG